jgi:hypothetical protein
MYHLKMEKPMSNAKRARMPTLPELFDDNKSLSLLLQVQVNNRLTPGKLTTTSGNKHLQHLRPLNSGVMMIHLVPTAYVQETSLETLNAMALKYTTRHKPIWEPLLPLKITSKTLQQSDASKLTSVSPLPRLKKEVPDTTDPRQVPTPGVDQSILVSDDVATVPSTQWLKKVEAKMK